MILRVWEAAGSEQIGGGLRLTATDKSHDLHAITGVKRAISVFFARDKLQISFHRAVFVVDLQATQQLTDSCSRCYLLWLAVNFDSDHCAAWNKECNQN